MPFYVVILNLENARVSPLALWAELDVSHDGRERVRANVIPKLGIIERLRRLHGLLQDLKLSVGPRRHVISQRIDTFCCRPGLITRNEIGHAGELHLLHW